MSNVDTLAATPFIIGAKRMRNSPENSKNGQNFSLNLVTTWLTSFVCGGLLLVDLNSLAASDDASRIMATNRASGALPAFNRFVIEKRWLAESICKKHEQHLSS